MRIRIRNPVRHFNFFIPRPSRRTSSYRICIQPSKENIQHLKTIRYRYLPVHFLSMLFFTLLSLFCSLGAESMQIFPQHCLRYTGTLPFNIWVWKKLYLVVLNFSITGDLLVVLLIRNDFFRIPIRIFNSLGSYMNLF